MALVSDILKGCGVKVSTSVAGVEVSGSGVLYLTPNYLSYNYVLTAKHLFQEDSLTPYSRSKLGAVELFFIGEQGFIQLELIKKKALEDNLIIFEQDLVIIKVRKNPNITFRQILVSDEMEDSDVDFFSWAIFAANLDDLHKFDMVRNDSLARRYKMHGNYIPELLKGMSGAGIFSNDRSVLLGIVSRYPNVEFQNETVDAARITFAEVNIRLRSLGLIEMDMVSSYHKREINRSVVDIHQAFINNTCLDLELARKRLTKDIIDDWFHDPLRYIDLLNQEYLFSELSPYLGGKQYIAQEAERFYVPKKKFTLRLALLLPFVDRIMYMACVGILAPKLDAALIPTVYSARFNQFSDSHLILNGVEQWKKMQYQLSDTANMKDMTGKYSFNCVIEIDLLNFYDNINKELLHRKILRVCDTPNEQHAAVLLHEILCKISSKDVGLPQNSDASSLLASFYLNQVDIFMQHHAPEYFRFMDDIRIFCKDKYEARKILQTFEFELRRCYLSVNSQKTEIITIIDKSVVKPKSQEKLRSEFSGPFDLEMAKISRYRNSDNFQYRNEAFHSAVELLNDNLWEDDAKKDDVSKKMNYALNTIAMLAGNGLGDVNLTTNFISAIKDAVEKLIDRPWMTTELCKVLNLLPKIIVEEYMLDPLLEIVLLERFNTYSFQAYHIWMLFAKHKIDMVGLRKYAVRQVEKNDDTNRAAIAAMVIYLSSVDPEYRRVILRKYSEGFARDYFQNRIVLIALRSFRPEIVDGKNTPVTLLQSHKFSHRFKDRDLVFIRGYDEQNDENGDQGEQLYSL